MRLIFVDRKSDWWLEDLFPVEEWNDFYHLVKTKFMLMSDQLNYEIKNGINIYPQKENIFRIFKKITPNKIKVVILGQDPYHNGNAVGFAFSVENAKINPSVKNIYKELEKEGFYLPNKNGDLSHWVDQGVFLLNTALTVRESQAESHLNLWNEFTNILIKYLDELPGKFIFVLWGNNAQKYSNLITNHKILKSSHPSPFSCDRGFFGNDHFKLINKHLLENNMGEIKW